MTTIITTVTTRPASTASRTVIATASARDSTTPVAAAASNSRTMTGKTRAALNTGWATSTTTNTRTAKATSADTAKLTTLMVIATALAMITGGVGDSGSPTRPVPVPLRGRDGAFQLLRAQPD